MDVYETTKFIEEIPAHSSLLHLTIESMLYIFFVWVRISKLIIGSSFFVMNYFITKCIMLTDEEPEGICSYFHTEKTWYIERVTKEILKKNLK